MFGKIIGAIAGKKLASRPGGISSSGGALLGAGAVTVLRRLSPLGLVAALAGGYAAKRYYDKKQDSQPADPAGAPQAKKAPASPSPKRAA